MVTPYVYDLSEPGSLCNAHVFNQKLMEARAHCECLLLKSARGETLDILISWLGPRRAWWLRFSPKAFPYEWDAVIPEDNGWTKVQYAGRTSEVPSIAIVIRTINLLYGLVTATGTEWHDNGFVGRFIDYARSSLGATPPTAGESAPLPPVPTPVVPQQPRAKLWDVGDGLTLNVNQGERDATIIAVDGDYCLAEYDMPAGTSALQIFRRDGTGGYRTISYTKLSLKWLRKIVEGGQPWSGRPQQSGGKQFPPPAEYLRQRLGSDA